MAKIAPDPDYFPDKPARPTVKAAKRKRAKRKVAPQGAPKAAAPVEPAVELAQLPEGVTVLDLLDAEFKKRIVMGDAERIACVLWTAHTFVYDRFQVTPRLFVTSKVPDCGKSTLLEAISFYSNAAVIAGPQTTEAAIGRLKTQSSYRTLLLDQRDNTLGREDRNLIDLVCAGSTEGVRDMKVGKDADGNHELHEFDLFYPIVVAKIGRLPDTALDSRCLEIRLHPATPEESAAILAVQYAERKGEPTLRRRLAEALAGFELKSLPAIPEGLANRERDIWLPLLALADHFGGHWPAWARDALAEFRERGQDKPEIRHHVEFLRKVYEITQELDQDPFSNELDAALRAKGVKNPEAARTAHLPGVGVYSRAIRRGGRKGTVLRGYKRADVAEAARRYLTRVTDV